MESSKIVYQGDTAKYKLTIQHADFDQECDDYWVLLTWGMFGKYVIVRKADMKHDEEGNHFLCFDSSDMVGWVKAACYYNVPDSDVEGGIREEVNYQWLCFVTSEPSPRLCGNREQGGDGHVTYTRVYANDVNTAYLNLRDSQQQNLLDSEGRQLRVHKSEEDMADYYEDK